MSPQEQNEAISEWMGCSVRDFTSDLNAIHEAESRLTFEQAELFMRYLVPDADDWVQKPLTTYWKICTATAPQRCEALLRTLGLWKEDAR